MIAVAGLALSCFEDGPLRTEHAATLQLCLIAVALQLRHVAVTLRLHHIVATPRFHVLEPKWSFSLQFGVGVSGSALWTPRFVWGNVSMFHVANGSKVLAVPRKN